MGLSLICSKTPALYIKFFLCYILPIVAQCFICTHILSSRRLHQKASQTCGLLGKDALLQRTTLNVWTLVFGGSIYGSGLGYIKSITNLCLALMCYVSATRSTTERCLIALTLLDLKTLFTTELK